eukprot:TRINITY_DN52024_c0_g1_i1.p1 TRINITY_DN52024_c0_g1~~TRINITY_DN52024_c0_g1_i1.p1  ORF type:complete len:152 (+),score=22.06 TRINITY_DN52024_c0_g1_i1:48-458(+)
MKQRQHFVTVDVADTFAGNFDASGRGIGPQRTGAAADRAIALAGFDRIVLDRDGDRAAVAASLVAHANISFTQSSETRFSALHPIPVIRNDGAASTDPSVRHSHHGPSHRIYRPTSEIGRAVQQECRDRSRMPSSA